MKNLTKLSRKQLKSLSGGLRACQDGCAPNQCCLTGNVCGTPGNGRLCQAPDSNGCAAGTYYCDYTLSCIPTNQLCTF
ncbi:bacteriocin-like protein [Chryseobacterium aquaticum]|uniref:bacteriocin-like protein n=1 Tax=Chryseobacterium aquaticum TaxID=452084 RepID=UPI0039F4F430